MSLISSNNAKRSIVRVKDEFSLNSGDLNGRFLDGNKVKWEVTTGTFSVSNGVVKLTNTGGNAVCIASFYCPLDLWYMWFTVTEALSSNGDDGYAVFNFKDINNYYAVTNGGNGDNTKIRLLRCLAGTTTVLATSGVITQGSGAAGAFAVGDSIGIYCSGDYVNVDVRFSVVLDHYSFNRALRYEPRFGLYRVNNGVAPMSTAVGFLDLTPVKT
jgi:hypothetical protein